MSILIDIQCIPKVFEPTDPDYDKFDSISNWLYKGKGQMIFWGTKYKQELWQMTKYLKVFNELEKKSKWIHINDGLVDKRENELAQCNTNKRFNDKHIVALLDVSDCRLCCSVDKESWSYIQNKNNYKPPKKIFIYSGRSQNKDLLKNNHKCIKTPQNVI